MPAYSHLIGINDAFPDPDMLPVRTYLCVDAATWRTLALHPAPLPPQLGVVMHQNATGGGIYGPPSPTHLTHDEQRTLMTLCIIACVMGGGDTMGGLRILIASCNKSPIPSLLLLPAPLLLSPPPRSAPQTYAAYVWWAAAPRV